MIVPSTRVDEACTDGRDLRELCSSEMSQCYIRRAGVEVLKTEDRARLPDERREEEGCGESQEEPSVEGLDGSEEPASAVEKHLWCP